MTERKLDCLKDCNAWCCKTSRLFFPFTADEAVYLKACGAVLTPGTKNGDSGYYFDSDCPFLRENKCIKHNKKTQPLCCAINKPGGEVCLEMRNRAKQRLRSLEIE